MAAIRLKGLVIDDQRTMREIVRRLLQTIGITHVNEVESGNTAVQILLARGFRWDFIICDLHMADGSGIEFLNKISGNDRLKDYEKRVIVLTGDKNPVVHEAAREAGAASIILKPCSSAQLAQAISDVVGFRVALKHAEAPGA